MGIIGTVTLLTILFSLIASCWFIFSKPTESLTEEIRDLIRFLIRSLTLCLMIGFFALLAYTFISVISTSTVDFRIFGKLRGAWLDVLPGYLAAFGVIILLRLVSSEIRRRTNRR
jgi:hypothetical protein